MACSHSWRSSMVLAKVSSRFSVVVAHRLVAGGPVLVADGAIVVVVLAGCLGFGVLEGCVQLGVVGAEPDQA